MVWGKGVPLRLSKLRVASVQEKGEGLKVFSYPFSPSPFALNRQVLVSRHL
ncbi:hypothetical protein FDUTEX481_02005 [Tolypothrix sp. PCC 7601]|nr:hypothetical protein FDUTEX481_02005 [Tolypothrix sp. PCC 7601]